MRLGRAVFAFAFGASVTLAGAEARAADPAAAREQVKFGYQLAQDGKCEEAIPHFVESLRLDMKAITLINLAACEERTSKLTEALGHWVEAHARAQIEGSSAIEEEAEKKTAALEARVPKLTVRATGAPPDAEFLRDGTALSPASMGVPLPVNPGTHTVVVRAQGHEDHTIHVTLAEGETQQVDANVGDATKATATSLSEATGGKISPLVYAGFGTAAVSAALGMVTGLMAFGKAGTAKDECPSRVDCSQVAQDAASAGRSLGTVSTVGFVVAGAGAAVGVYGLVWGKPSSSASGPSVAVSLGPTGGSVRGTF